MRSEQLESRVELNDLDELRRRNQTWRRNTDVTTLALTVLDREETEVVLKMEDATMARTERTNDLTNKTTLTTVEMIKMTEDDLTTVDLHLLPLTTERRLTHPMDDIMEDSLKWTRRRFESLEFKDELSDSEDHTRRNPISRRRTEATELLETPTSLERTETLTTDLDPTTPATALDEDKMTLMMIRMTAEMTMMTDDPTETEDQDEDLESKDSLQCLRRRSERLHPREDELLTRERSLMSLMEPTIHRAESEEDPITMTAETLVTTPGMTRETTDAATEARAETEAASRDSHRCLRIRPELFNPREDDLLESLAIRDPREMMIINYIYF